MTEKRDPPSFVYTFLGLLHTYLVNYCSIRFFCLHSIALNARRARRCAPPNFTTIETGKAW